MLEHSHGGARVEAAARGEGCDHRLATCDVREQPARVRVRLRLRLRLRARVRLRVRVRLRLRLRVRVRASPLIGPSSIVRAQ